MSDTRLRCSFCNRNRREHDVFAGPDVRICRSCVATASQIFEHTAKVGEYHRKSAALHCSFCLKSEAELNMLCAGPDAHICDACATAAAGTLTRSRTDVEHFWSAVLRRALSWRGRGSPYQPVEAL